MDWIDDDNGDDGDDDNGDDDDDGTNGDNDNGDDGDVEMIVWEQTVGAKLVLLPPHSYSGQPYLQF